MDNSKSKIEKIESSRFFFNLKTKSLTIIVTRKCPRNCNNCVVEKNDTEFDENKIEQLLPIIEKYEIDRIKLFGGEPLLRPYFIEKLIKIFKSQYPNLSFELNSSLPFIKFNDDFWKVLTKNKVNLFLNDIVLDESEKINSAVYELAKTGLVCMNLTVAPGNWKQSFLKLKKAVESSISRLNILPVYFSKWEEQDFEQFDNFLSTIIDYIKETNIKIENVTRKSSIPIFNPSLMIDTEGSVYWTNIVLCRIDEDLKKELYLGNIDCFSLDKPIFKLTSDEFIDKFMSDYDINSINKIGSTLDWFIRKVEKVNEEKIINFEIKNLKKNVNKVNRIVEKLEIHLSYSCSDNCIFCSEQNRLQKFPGYIIPVHEIISWIKIGKIKGYQHITLTGGEPTVYPFIDEVLLYARNQGYYNYITTNGSGLADIKQAEKILPLVDEICYSIYSLDSKIVEMLSRKAVRLNRIYKAVENHLNINPSLPRSINMVMTKYNIDSWHEVLQFAEEKGFKRILFSNPAPVGAAKKNYESIALSLKNWPLFCKELLRLVKKHKIIARIFGVPACILGENGKYLSNDLFWDAKETVECVKYGNTGPVLKGKVEYKPSRDRTYIKQCLKCSWNKICGGIFNGQLNESYLIKPIN